MTDSNSDQTSIDQTSIDQRSHEETFNAQSTGVRSASSRASTTRASGTRSTARQGASSQGTGSQGRGAGASGRSGGAVIRVLDPQAVAHLTVARGYPCISVLMPTTPSGRMAKADAGRLSGLLHDVKRQLEDQQVTSRDRLLSELEQLARIARDSRTESALGLFVNLSMSRGWTLPVSVSPKAVVEATFATRDLLRALHRTPPHMVIRLDAFGARMFWVSGRVTLLETVERIPKGATHAIYPPGATHSRPDTEGGVEDRRDFLGRVDACLGRLRSERPSPLVLAGDPALVTELKGRARWLHRLAGDVLDTDAAHPGALFSAAALCLEDYLYRRGQQTLYALNQAAAEAPERLTAGLDDCWEAVNSHTPGTLVVEHGYIYPRPSGGPGERASHDVIDDLLELALERGNLIAFVEDGQLHEFGGIALLRTQ